MTRHAPAGDFDYTPLGDGGYTAVRRPDARIEARIHAALGPARTVLNVGAGAGSYEPRDRVVVAVEPSPAMRAQRPHGLVPAVDAVAEALPFDDDAFDAAMTTLSVHQWPDVDAGLRELRRVARGPVVVMTFDGDALERHWMVEYVPEVFTAEARRYPSLAHLASGLGGSAVIEEVPIPLDCADGFIEAFYGRPEAYLDPAVRAAQSAWRFVEPAAVERGMAALAADLESGALDERHGALRSRPEFDGALRLVVATPA